MTLEWGTFGFDSLCLKVVLIWNRVVCCLTEKSWFPDAPPNMVGKWRANSTEAIGIDIQPTFTHTHTLSPYASVCRRSTWHCATKRSQRQWCDTGPCRCKTQAWLVLWWQFHVFVPGWPEEKYPAAFSEAAFLAACRRRAWLSSVNQESFVIDHVLSSTGCCSACIFSFTLTSSRLQEISESPPSIANIVETIDRSLKIQQEATPSVVFLQLPTPADWSHCLKQFYHLNCIQKSQGKSNHTNF